MTMRYSSDSLIFRKRVPGRGQHTERIVFQLIGVVCFVLIFGFAICQPSSRLLAADKPNILVILCDDLGYGDIATFNPNCKFKTPAIDRLAREGVAFTDAHSSSAVCTPTRYGLITGRYGWRSRLQSGVLGGLSPRLIEPNVRTIAEVLREQGYETACYGKWHLGLDWQPKENATQFSDKVENGDEGWLVDFEKPFRGGPLSLGFDRFFGIAASLDMIPYTFLHNDRVAVVPTVNKDFPMMLGRNEAMSRRGPAAADFEAETVLSKLTDKTIEFVTEHADRQSKPFFCYVPLASPHTPIVPTEKWRGHSGTTFYGDFVEETDDAIGRIITALDQQGLAERTLVIVTSDNGCALFADIAELARLGHQPSSVLRGQKADIFEGGHRVPFVARWTGHLPAGKKCSALIGLQDTFATCAEAAGIDLPENVAVDSFSWLPLVTANPGRRATRASLVHHSINGSFALRRDRWKLCFCRDSGGWSDPKPDSPVANELHPLQLYDLENDLAEQHNLASSRPDRVLELTNEMEQLIERGRSNEGPPLPNTVRVKWNRPKL